MTLFAKPGLRPALFCAAFLSLAASTSLAGNIATASGHGVKAQTGHVDTGYTPRVRIADHPRNRNRTQHRYVRGGRTIRVIDTSTSTSKAPKSAFNAQRSGGVSYANSYDRLVLRYLRESIDAIEIDNARARAADHLRRRGLVNGDVYPSELPAEGYERLPESPSQGVLTEAATENPLRPRSEITRVSESQKRLGEERAAARAERFNRENGAQHFRFYRANEAYDARFPSVVYLNSQ